MSNALPPWLLPCCLFAMGLMVAAGCNTEQVVRLEYFLDELEFDSSLETVAEVEVGSYRVASAIPRPTFGDSSSGVHWVHIRFTLYAVIRPEEEEALVAACERNRGVLDDAVVTVCRRATIDELSEVRTAILKARLVDALRPHLEGIRIRELSFADSYTWQPI